MVQLLRKYHWISALIIAVILSLILTAPGLLHLTTKLIGGGGDTYQFQAFQMLVKQKLQAGEYPFSKTTLWRYPAGFDLSHGYDSFASNLVGGALSLALGNANLAFNLTLLGSLVFDMLCGYFLFFTVFKSRKIGLLGLLGFGASFYNLARATGHLNLLLNGGFALLAAALWNIWQRPGDQQRVRDYFFLTLSISILGVSSAQYFAMSVIAVGLVGIATLILYPQKTRTVLTNLLKNWQRYLPTLIIPVCMFLVVLLPFVLALSTGISTFRGDHSPRLVDLFMPNPLLSTMLSQNGPVAWADRNVEHVIFIGWLEWLAFVIAIGWLVTKKMKKGVALLLTLFVVFLIFTLGMKNPETGLVLPYSLLVRLFPFSAISEQGRFVIFANMLLLIFIAAHAVATKWVTKPLFYVLLAGMLIERISWSGYPLVDPVGGDHIRTVQSMPGSAVLDLPVSDTRHDMNPALYHKAIVGGYLHWMAETPQTQEFLQYNDEIYRFDCNEYASQPAEISWIARPEITKLYEDKNRSMLNRLKSNDVRTIVLHKDYQYYWENCENVIAQKTALFPPIGLAQPTSLRNRLTHIKWAGSAVQQAGLFFPKSGYIKIDSVNFSPAADRQTFSIALDKQPLDLSAWSFTPDAHTQDSFWTSPNDKNTIFAVTAGSTLTFTTSNYQNVGFITISYSYDADEGSDAMPLQFNGLEKVYDDEQKEVFLIL